MMARSSWPASSFMPSCMRGESLHFGGSSRAGQAREAQSRRAGQEAAAAESRLFGINDR